MQVPLNACCVGGPVVTQSPVSAGAMLILAAIYAMGAFVAAGATFFALQ